MPEKRRDWQEHRLPCSYANFLILNGGVLVPSFDDPRDGEAVRVLGSVFPGRRIVPVDCSDLIIGLGSIHCLSQQQPAPPRT
jgi:agmatine deiminase